MREVPILETERLTIRPYRPSDLQSSYAIKQAIGWVDATQPHTTQLATEERYLSRTNDMIALLATLAQPSYGDRAVCWRETGDLIGMVGYVPYVSPFGQLPMFGGIEGAKWTAEVGLMWAIDPAWQQRGLATEAAQALIDFAFAPGPLNLKRIIATTDYDNLASQAVMQKLGMDLQRNPFPEPVWFQVVGVLENPAVAKGADSK